ncbi:MAG: hypothetical protein FJ147_04045 [Deltaproteobacteria bacterium]|nr:hypothetical protein [Deltaproteobacteria bacterium]
MSVDKDPREEHQASDERLLRIAVLGMVAGLVCLLPYLWLSFGVWTFGLTILLGVPLVLVSAAAYVWVVIRDLKQRGLL